MNTALTEEEKSLLIRGILTAAMAVMAIDMGILSCAMEAIALGRELENASRRHAHNPLIASLLDSGALRRGLAEENLRVEPEEVRSGRVLDRALEQVERAMAVARARADEETVREYARQIVSACEAVARAAGAGLFGTGERVTAAERDALARIREHLGLRE
jgi:hypothetical protein